MVESLREEEEEKEQAATLQHKAWSEGRGGCLGEEVFLHGRGITSENTAITSNNQSLWSMQGFHLDL